MGEMPGWARPTQPPPPPADGNGFGASPPPPPSPAAPPPPPPPPPPPGAQQWVGPQQPGPGASGYGGYGGYGAGYPGYGGQPGHPGYPGQPGQSAQWGGGPAHGWGGWSQPMASGEFKPGIVPLRPLSVGEILDGGFATIRRHPRIVFGFAFVLGALTELVQAVLRWGLSDVGGSILTSLPTDSYGRRFTITTGSVASSILSLVASAIFAAVLAGVVTVIVGKAVLGQRVDGRETIGAVKARWWPLLGGSILAAALPVLPFVALVAGPLAILPAAVVGVYFWGKFALIVPALMLERIGVGASVARSWRLVRGAFWRVWGMRALASLIVGIAGSVLALPFGISTYSAIRGGNLPSGGDFVLSSIGTGVIWTLTQPLLAAVITLIYVDRRMRSEGLDLQLARASMSMPSSGAAASPGQL